MEEEKRELIKELIYDVIFTIFIIGATVYAVIYIFPNISKVNVMSNHEYLCSDLNKCDCSYDGYCVCKYYKGDDLSVIYEEKCDK